MSNIESETSIKCQVDILTQLPKEVVCCVLLDWVELSDVCRVDSAYCSHSLRDLFLQVLSSDWFVYSDMPIHYMSKVPPFITWSVQRGIHVNTADLSSNINQHLLCKFLQICTTKNLKCLALHDFNSDSKIFNALSKECAHLRDLICSSCQFGRSLPPMLRALKQLEILSIESCKSLRATQFKGVNLPKLHTLAIVDCECNNATLKAVCAASPVVRRLLLTKSHSFTSSCLVQALQPMHTTLRVLGLEGLPFLTDEAVTQIASLLPSLEVIDLSHCTSLTNTAIVALAKECPLIQRVYIQHNENYTDAALAALAVHSQHLVALHASYCGGFSPQGICNLLDSCHRVDTLYFGGGRRQLFMQEDLILIVSKCAQLTYKLSLNVPILSDKVLEAIGKYCKGLQHLDLHTCNGYTDKGMLQVAMRCTKLLNLVVSESSLGVLAPLARGLWEFMRPDLQISVDPTELGYDLLS